MREIKTLFGTTLLFKPDSSMASAKLEIDLYSGFGIPIDYRLLLRWVVALKRERDFSDYQLKVNATFYGVAICYLGMTYRLSAKEALQLATEIEALFNDDNRQRNSRRAEAWQDTNRTG